MGRRRRFVRGLDGDFEMVAAVPSLAYCTMEGVSEGRVRRSWPRVPGKHLGKVDRREVWNERRRRATNDNSDPAAIGDMAQQAVG